MKAKQMWVAAVVVCAAGRSPAAGQVLHLIPMPREVRSQGAAPLPNGAHVVCAAGCNEEDRFASEDLTQALALRGVPDKVAGAQIRLVHAPQLPPDFDPAMRLEGYAIACKGSEITVTAATSAGLFYGAQTVKQMVEVANGQAMLQAAAIRDWPAMRYRGLDDDLSRGPVPTLDFQKKLIRTLAAYKVNVYSPYFEHAMQYAANPLPAPPGGSMSRADAEALVAYARPYHVTIIPEQEAFGHLHHALKWEQYRDLAETPHGAVLAPGQAGSIPLIKQWFTELAAIYPGPFLHIGADETVDLGEGQTRADVDARGLGQVYLDFMQRIVEALRPLGRKLLFWGDIAMNSPDLVKAMPQSFKDATIAVAWEYNPQPRGFDRYLTPFTNAGFETWVASGVNNWSRVYPNFGMGLQNIQGFVRDGQRLGCTGLLNTIWNDDGEGLINMDWYGVLFGAAAGWQKGESSIPQFQGSYGEVFHGDATGKLNEAQQEMIAAHALLKEQAKTGDGSDGLFWMDPWSKDGLTYGDKLRPYVHDVRLHAERALTLIAQARAAAPGAAPTFTVATGAPVYNAAAAYPSNPTSLRETDAIDALELGARRMDFLALKFQLADEMALAYQRAYAGQGTTDKKLRQEVARQLGEINNSANGRLEDLRDGYSLLRDLYEQAWLRSNRAYALRPVLEHYDATVALWLGRSDKMRSVQRQWSDSHTLPPASEVGIPAPPAGMN